MTITFQARKIMFIDCFFLLKLKLIQYRVPNIIISYNNETGKQATYSFKLEISFKL